MTINNEPIVTEFKLSEKDYVELYRFSNLRITRSKPLIAILSLLVLIYVFAMIGVQIKYGLKDSWSSRDFSQTIILILLVGSFVLFFLYQRYFGFRNKYRKHPYIAETVYRCTFHPYKITMTSTERTVFVESNVVYPSYKNVIETADYFFLYHSRRNKFCIPKEGMDTQQQEKLRALFRFMYQNRFIIRR